jgi:hypothetical protein
MTKPGDIHRDRQTEATADREAEVRPELEDLDVTGDDADAIGGGADEFLVMKYQDKASP